MKEKGRRNRKTCVQPPRGNWGNAYARARLEAGLTQEEAAEKLYPFRNINRSINSLSTIENERTSPDAALVMAMETLYGKPDLHKTYCRGTCAIGRKTKMIPINYKLSAVIPKLALQLSKLGSILGQLPVLLEGKEYRDDFADWEWEIFLKYLERIDRVQKDIEILDAYLDRLAEELEIGENETERKKTADAAK